MKERPILFSAPMVRAILAGTKTQTRRIVKPRPAHASGPGGIRTSTADWSDLIACPYGQPGDRLWVKETFAAFGRWETRFSATKGRDEWRFVDMTIECGHKHSFDLPIVSGRRTAGATPAWHIRPSLFMPRQASRILLEVTAVRVEQLARCSESDARAEGVVIEDRHMNGRSSGESAPPAVRAYRELWEQINGAGTWDDNPSVWVIEFKRAENTGDDATST